MQRKSLLTFFLLLGMVVCFLALVVLAGSIWLWNSTPAKLKDSQTLFQGVTYQRQIRQQPRRTVVHIVKVDLRQKGLSFLVTPGDPKADLPLKARTTSQFLDEYGLQVAINGDGFTPWRSNGPFDYYPHPGDPVSPIGLAASKGTVYSQSTDSEPTLYLSRTNLARFNAPPGKIYHAISGNIMLVDRGKSLIKTSTELPDGNTPQPRTAVGLDKRGKYLIIVIVDGRQPGNSEGATLAELAEIFIDLDAYYAMNLDGGGSSSLVIEDPNGSPRLLNSPVDLHIPGRERPVANHLGIFAPPND